MNAPARTPPPAEPDWAKLEELSERAGRMKAAGELTSEAYDALLDEAELASNGHPEVVEVLAPYDPT